MGKISHRVCLLSDPFKSLAARLALIKYARKSIDIQTFIWGEDALSFYLLSELQKAVERGVSVRLLVDGWIGVDNPSLIAMLQKYQQSILSKHYNPPTKVICPSFVRLLRSSFDSLSKVNHRMHAKSFIIDDSWAIIGGRNYEAKYFGLDSEHLYRDREALVYGPVVKEISNVYNKYWDADLSVPTHDLTFTYSSVTKPNRFKRFYNVRIPEEVTNPDGQEELKDFLEWFNRFKFAPYLLKNKSRAESISLIWDEPGDMEGKLSTGAKHLVDMISEQKSSLKNAFIHLQTPYLLFDNRTLQKLSEVCHVESQINLVLITNSYLASDNIIAHLLGLRDRRRFSSACKCVIYETAPIPKPPLGRQSTKVKVCNHSKTLLIGDDLVYIGSSNFDPRSNYYNSEIGLVIKGKTTYSIFREDLESDIMDGRAVTYNCEERPLDLSRITRMMVSPINGKYTLTHFLRMLAYIFQFLLPNRLKRLF